MSMSSLAAVPRNAVSPLVLADQLLTLAQDADRAGLHRPAELLLKLAYAVYAEKPPSA
jgi:hypothetical protein